MREPQYEGRCWLQGREIWELGEAINVAVITSSRSEAFHRDRGHCSGQVRQAIGQ